ncbi:MAG: GntR family transcriptional regulator [Cereibacter sp.]|jgi:GntR family transcriptional regulator/MocR family aminotransferase|nr:GntR family transcriptional regulator [Cereibacter sp.]
MSIPVESFFLNPTAAGTLQQQIRQMVAEGVLAGRYRPGDRMPSSRGLAQHLGISRITVTLAYTDLVSSDYLVARGRSGYFVSDTAPRQPEFPPRRSGTECAVDYAALTGSRFSGQERLAKPEDWSSYRYPFIYGQADVSLFDHRNWRLCALRALGKRDFEALTSDYYERDDPLLIEYILRHILPRRGIIAAPDEVLLTLGAQNALWLTAQLMLNPERRAVLENPCYPGLRAVVRQTGCAMASVDVDQDGLPSEALPAADVVFTTASHHCPTNATMPLERRRALLEAASARNFTIVEDDYEFEMSFLKAVSPSLKSLDREGRVIYVGSFSKSLFPGLRLGYIVAPAPFIREARALRATVLRHPPGHIQRTAAYFLSLGHYDALINRTRAAYKRRRILMDEAIREQGLTIAGQGGFGGSSLWMRAPDPVDTEDLALRLQARGVLIEPGRLFFDPAAASRRHYRLAFSSIPNPRIPEGIALIARAIAETGLTQA